MPTYVYCVDDNGDGSQDNTTQSTSTLDWSKADTSFANLIAYDAAALTNPGNIIYVADDHVDSGTTTYTGPANESAPVIIISADKTQATPTYKKGSSAQMTSSGNNTIDGNFALYGVEIRATYSIFLAANAKEGISAYDCHFKVTNQDRNIGIYVVSSGLHGLVRLTNCQVTCGDTADGSNAIFSLSENARLEAMGLTLYTSTRRLYLVASSYSADAEFSGCDFTNLTRTGAALVGDNQKSFFSFANCIMPSTWQLAAGAPEHPGIVSAYNIGPADAPTFFEMQSALGSIEGDASVSRSGGASVEAESCAWLITTSAFCSEGSPFYTPWIYGTTTNGTKTFTVYGCATNSAPITATPQDDEIWLEVQTLSTADEATWALSTDHRTITTAAADQTTETDSTWSGVTEDFRFKLECAGVVVGESGQYRARVAVGIPSVTATSTLYIDPKVTVT